MKVDKIDAVVEVKETIIEPERFVLNISREEAELIGFLIGRTSFRDTHTHNIASGMYHSLGKAGVETHFYGGKYEFVNGMPVVKTN